ncbi:MAG: FAD-dependent oxidoreductase [Pseudomonadota bacterium]
MNAAEKNVVIPAQAGIQAARERRSVQPPDVIVIGGGIIGLSSAWALCREGLHVQIYDTAIASTQASWAGGGILSPLPPGHCEPGLKPLLDESLRAYPGWCAELQSLTGIDPQFWRCGAQMQDQWWPDIAQVRSPRLLAALRNALRLKGAEVIESAVEEILIEEGRVCGVKTQGKKIACAHVVLATGAWSGQLHPPTGVKPIKGEMLLLRGKPGLLQYIVLDDEIYLVPRKDGRILVGSTLEEVGFDSAPTCAARVHLLNRATRLWPALAHLPIEQHWAGLRPRTSSGLPLIGASETEGLFLNTGHFRLGITLAPASAHHLVRSVTKPTSIAVHPQTPLLPSACTAAPRPGQVHQRS